LEAKPENAENVQKYSAKPSFFGFRPSESFADIGAVDSITKFFLFGNLFSSKRDLRGKPSHISPRRLAKNPDPFYFWLDKQVQWIFLTDFT